MSSSLIGCPIHSALCHIEAKSFVNYIIILSQWMNNSIWAIDGTLTGTTTSGKSRPKSNGNEEILYMSQISGLESDHQMPFRIILWTAGNKGPVIKECFLCKFLYSILSPICKNINALIKVYQSIETERDILFVSKFKPSWDRNWPLFLRLMPYQKNQRIWIYDQCYAVRRNLKKK